MVWTKFFDMSSGGLEKTEWGIIYIEAKEDDAKSIFERTFGRDPENETCNCCGCDYSISEGEDLEKLTQYYREYSGASLEDYKKSPRVKFIHKEDINPPVNDKEN